MRRERERSPGKDSHEELEPEIIESSNLRSPLRRSHFAAWQRLRSIAGRSLSAAVRSIRYPRQEVDERGSGNR